MAHLVGDNLANVSPTSGSETTAVASPTRKTNNAVSPGPALRRSRSPIESYRKSSAVDLTSASPPRRSKRAAPTDINPTPDQVRSTKRVRISADEVFLVRGKYKIPADAVPVPDPQEHIIRLFGMGKPGANSSYRPQDSLAGPNLGGSGFWGFRNPPATPKTYGTKLRPSFQPVKYVEKQPVDDEEIETPYKHSLSNDSYPSKRRKLEHSTSPSQRQTIELDEDKSEMQAHSRSHRSPSAQRSTISPSKRSASSLHTTLGGSGRRTRSEFESTGILTNPHRKQTETSLTSDTPSRLSHEKVKNGAAHSSPIVIDDEDSHIDPKKMKQPQFANFQQGLDSFSSLNGHTSPLEVTSEHFQKSVPRINESTLPPRGEPKDVQDPARRTSRIFRDKKRSFDADRISDDDLAIAPAQAIKRTKSPLKRVTRGKLDVRTSEGGPPGQGWLLLFVRTHDYVGHESPMTLKGGKDSNSYRIVGPDNEHADMMTQKHEILLSKVVQAETDEMDRIRLKGSRDANGLQYTVDLHFEEPQDFVAFRALVAKSITAGKVFTKAKDHMDSIFSKPLPGGNRADPFAATGPETSQFQAHSMNSTTNGSHPTRVPNLLEQLQTSASKGSDAFENIKRRGETRLDTLSTQSRSTRTSTRPTRNTRATLPIDLDGEDEEPKELEKYSLVHGLGAPWERQLNYGSGRRRAVIDFTDLERLDNGEFLNDQLIDFYLLYLFNQAKVPTDRVYIFNTHFFTTLTRKVPGQKGPINYSAVARWTSKEDLFGYDYIVVPINQDVHWYLAIICNVANISRKPALEELSSHELQLLAEPNSQQHMKPSEAKAAPKDEFRPPSTPEPTEGSFAKIRDDDEILFDEDESNLTLVDPNATKLTPCITSVNADGALRESPAAETAHMENMDIAESTPKGILPTTSSPLSSKKTKRKPGPPAKKWDPDEPTIIILDSLGSGARSQAVRALKDYIREEAQEKRGMEAIITQNAYYAKQNQIPMQDNFSDCGVYLLGYAQKFFDNPDDFKARLLKGEMDRDTDWPDMPMPEMRDTMRKILFDLHDQQEEERRQAKKAKKKGSKAAAPRQSTKKVEPKDTGAPITSNEASAEPKPTIVRHPNDSDDDVVQETPPERRSSPGSAWHAPLSA